ncbi:hypothetical protein DDP54_07320 [Cellulomonas sp. WB94]|uniref:DUF1648 domain-containing protein n=1 Tax=Cellulomonas sp. WB94 TaxID=2173174 RepID=UPI000D57C11F|nr:DUF1648 domain-containing protein [Cellulomonas sp. WB94]PVU82845.1 hypothetical protein DDP54_07320 [Cellulomonas sp. WB94]
MTGSDVSAAIDQYFERFRLAVLASGAQVDDDTVDDLRAYVLERVGAQGSTADVSRVLAELGTPQALAVEVASAGPQDEGPRRRGIRSHGRLLGVPYDLRAPSSARDASRWWNPLDRRILVPKSWGVGWSVNVGALAVRTGAVRPDDEDVPFGAVPPRAVAATLAAPVAVLAAVGALAAVTWRRLPPTVPTKWSLSGDVTAHGSRGPTMLGLVGLAAVPTAMAAGVHARRSPALDRVAASAQSLLLATTALSVLAQTVHTARGRGGVWPLWAGRAASAALPFALLVGVSRMGRTAEQRHDLSTLSMNGPAA